MVTNTFFANLRTRFYKIDIFKNVQNENLEMNLERSFSRFNMVTKKLYSFIIVQTTNAFK
jgi:hypothetical protein